MNQTGTQVSRAWINNESNGAPLHKYLNDPCIAWLPLTQALMADGMGRGRATWPAIGRVHGLRPIELSKRAGHGRATWPMIDRAHGTRPTIGRAHRPWPAIEHKMRNTTRGHE